MANHKYHLSNNELAIVLSAKGAELQSLVHTATGIEYMWSGDPGFWGKRSPVLFPIVGGLKDNTYRYAERSYKMGRHGFARDKFFAVTAQTTNSIHFTLEADKETLEDYPFLFRFSLVYTLAGKQLSITYLVENTDNKPMFFSVGAHPAFAVPLVSESVFTDYYLLFSQKETAGKWPLSEEGLIKEVPVAMLENTDRLPLDKPVFYGDALVFKQLRSDSISICSDKTAARLTVAFEGFPYMGIWSAREADFVCIEPWCGIADHVNTTGDITEKEGIQSLQPGKQFTRTWRIIIS